MNNFVYARLSTLGPIRAALTSQDYYSSDIKFAPTQSRVTPPLKGQCHEKFFSVFFMNHTACRV